MKNYSFRFRGGESDSDRDCYRWTLPGVVLLVKDVDCGIVF